MELTNIYMGKLYSGGPPFVGFEGTLSKHSVGGGGITKFERTGALSWWLVHGEKFAPLPSIITCFFWVVPVVTAV
jgi:hypothetical protein